MDQLNNYWLYKSQLILVSSTFGSLRMLTGTGPSDGDPLISFVVWAYLLRTCVGTRVVDYVGLIPFRRFLLLRCCICSRKFGLRYGAIFVWFSQSLSVGKHMCPHGSSLLVLVSFHFGVICSRNLLYAY